MASPTAPLGGASPSGRVLGPALDRIIKNAAWRKHSALVAAAKAALDLLSSPSAYPSSDPTSPKSSPLLGLPPAAADAALHALLLALESASPKVADPALDCVAKLLYHRLLSGDLGCAGGGGDDASSPASRLLNAVLACGALSDDAMELATLRVVVAAARCPTVAIRGEGLGQVLKTCYNIYLSSSSGANQLCAKLALAQVMVIVFARVEVDTMDVRVRTVSITDMMDMSDRSLNDSSIVQVAQGFINEAMEGSDVPEPGSPVEPSEADGKDDAGMSKIREDGLALFKNLCKLSMKFSTPDNPEDQMLLRGKVLSLELLKMVVNNAGPFWRTNEKKPSKGIDFLIKSKKIGHLPEDVASFLRNTAGLNATMIGDYLGERDEFPIKVMHAYADALNFEDTAYVLAYSVIMLNTDAHNTMVKDKMSKTDFIRNNRGIDDGKDLPEAYLGTLYDQIVKNEIKMSADSSVPQNKQPSSVMKLLGLDNIISFVNWKQAEDRAVGANDLLIKNIQEKFKLKSGKSE
nr:unnamed protein product [Digitaria exilis]